jgi:thioredoxin-like negative regulator of GroEL
VRHLLGKELLQSGKLSEAESVYRADRAQNPANGWALYGMSAALKAKGRTTEAAQNLSDSPLRAREQVSISRPIDR